MSPIEQDAVAAYDHFDPSFEVPLVQQHYGIASSGLDVTFDLGTALFFATHSLGWTADGKGQDTAIPGDEISGVVYCLKFTDPPLRSTSAMVTELGIFDKYPPLRPLRQSCALPDFDSLAINEAMADTDAILVLEKHFDSSGIPTVTDLFPSPEDDPFYKVLLDAKAAYKVS
ncbi:MAG: hypothetical protein NTW21_22880 [Verrucomicrobia bacterium]|nr:hypothetical protein [Verrucomicrobiota bacterium]